MVTSVKCRKKISINDEKCPGICAHLSWGGSFAWFRHGVLFPACVCLWCGVWFATLSTRFWDLLLSSGIVLLRHKGPGVDECSQTRHGHATTASFRPCPNREKRACWLVAQCTTPLCSTSQACKTLEEPYHVNPCKPKEHFSKHQGQWNYSPIQPLPDPTF